MMMGPWGSGYGLLGWLAMLLFWVLLIAGVVLVVRWIIDERSFRKPSKEDNALSILKERYARGEIDKEQFETMKRDLS